MKKLGRHLTFANVVACLALFVALGGASYAAFKLPKNSVGTRQIKNNAITGAKIRKGAVSGAKIDLGSLGTVPSASSAASAALAQTAANAQLLQGQSAAQIGAAAKLSCPAGTTNVANTCFETQQRAAEHWEDAMRTCAKAGRMVPTVSQLAAYDVVTKNGDLEWTTNVWFSGTEYFALIFSLEENSSGMNLARISNESKPFRCVLAPAN